MSVLFRPFYDCYVELSSILFNYNVPLFNIPLYVFLILPLLFRLFLLPIDSASSSMSYVQSDISSAVYAGSRKVRQNVGKKINDYKISRNKYRGKFHGASSKPNMYD